MMEAFKDIFLEKYPKRDKILQYYTEANGFEPQWGNITKVSLNRMVMQMEKTLSPNSARQYCAQVKAVLTLCSEESGLAFDYGSILSLPEAMTTNVYVTEGEIDKLIHLSGLNKVEKYVRDQFVVGCLTGARHSDYSQFTPENARDGWLSYVSQKTRISCEIPVAPFVQGLVSDGSEALKARLITDVHFNNILRKVCLKAGINGTSKVYHAGKYLTGKKFEFVTSHTARRSCATNLALRGVDEVWISRILGHGKNITQRYVCVSNRDMPQNAMDYFLKTR